MLNLRTVLVSCLSTSGSAPTVLPCAARQGRLAMSIRRNIFRLFTISPTSKERLSGNHLGLNLAAEYAANLVGKVRSSPVDTERTTSAILAGSAPLRKATDLPSGDQAGPEFEPTNRSVIRAGGVVTLRVSGSISATYT